MKRRDFLRSTVLGAAALTMSSQRAIAENIDSAVLSTDGQYAATPAQVAEFDRPLRVKKPPYPQPPEMSYQLWVPRGVVFNFTMDDSKIFPGTSRTISVYVPAQYKGDKPACVMVMLDNLMVPPVICDNLIYQKKMPVTIGIALASGVTKAAHPSNDDPRYNRSFEFDSLTSVLADFIEHELLPAVRKQKTPDGRPILLSDDPNDRCITGGSTGAVGAFTVAWKRPDTFRRVFLWSITAVGMRGADRYTVLVRKTENKPLRVFMIDGTHDEWWGGPELGDWWMSNQALERALFYAGYEVSHIWGIWGHCAGPAVTFFPHAVRWLWKDWPKPVTAGRPGNAVISRLVQPGEGWRCLLEGKEPVPSNTYQFPGYVAKPVVDARSTAAALASDRQGRVFLQNPSTGEICRLTGRGKYTVFARVSPGNNGLAFGPDNRLYVAETARSRILAYDAPGHVRVVAEGLAGRCLVVTRHGTIYVTEANEERFYAGKVWLIEAGGKKRVVAEGLNGPSGIGLTPDGLWLCVGEHNGHHGWNYQVQSDGRLACGEPFYWFHVPDSANNCGIGQICFDRNGWGYAATRLGVQVFTTSGGEGGLVYAIVPVHEKQLAGICFGGRYMQTLYVSTGTEIYARKVRAVGVPQQTISLL